MASALAPTESFTTPARAERAAAHRCMYSKHHGDKLAEKRCVGCKLVFYCGREHQTADWKTHKSECKKLQITDVNTDASAAADHGPAAAAAAKTTAMPLTFAFTSAPDNIARAQAEELRFNLIKIPSGYLSPSVPYIDTPLQRQYLEQIKRFKHQEILGSCENECKRMGQEIFDEAKKIGGSQAGRVALQTFIGKLEPTHHLHFQYLEVAWGGVRDRNFTWQH